MKESSIEDARTCCEVKAFDVQAEVERLEGELARAKVEAVIAWNLLSQFRELVVATCFQGVVHLPGFSPIKALMEDKARLKEEITKIVEKRRAPKAEEEAGVDPGESKEEES